MNYKENLAKALKNGIDVLSLMVAHEFQCQIECEDIALSPDAFEDACYLIERAYLKTCETSIEDITRALIRMWVDDNQPLKEIDVWDLLRKASIY